MTPPKQGSADETAKKQQKIQEQQDQKDAENTAPAQQKPAPGPGRKEPAPPLPAQHLKKPGDQHAMQLQPKYLAPHYIGSGKLKGKVALITGGDSGIGRAVAILFAREGAHVAIAYLNEHADAQETCRLIEAEGTSSFALSGNVQDPECCSETVRQVVEKFGNLNILVNNAAFQEHAENIEDISAERLDQTFKTNIYGYFHMAQSALPYFHAGDCIINTGSITGLKGSKNLLDYSATKGAIHAFTKSLAHNLAGKGIRVNAVAPGPVWTPLNPADQSAQDIPEFGKKTHLGRPAQPEEIAPAYVFLAAECCSSYITGIVLPITGTAGDGA